MTPKHHDFWSGPVIGYGDVSGFCAGGQFERPGDFNYNPKVEAAKKAAAQKAAKQSRIVTNKYVPLDKVFPNEVKDGAKHGTGKGGKRAKTKKQNGSLRDRLNVAEQKLARAEREKAEKGRANVRLRYLQTCMMRLTLSLSAYVGEAAGFFDLVAVYPFEEEYVVTRDDDHVEAREAAGKHIYLKASIADDVITLGIYAERGYMVHGAKARCSADYVGKTWHIEDLW